MFFNFGCDDTRYWPSVRGRGRSPPGVILHLVDPAAYAAMSDVLRLRLIVAMRAKIVICQKAKLSTSRQPENPAALCGVTDGMFDQLKTCVRQ